MMMFKFNDGGREAAGFKGKAGDCVTRAVAIAAELPYAQVYQTLTAGAIAERRATGKSARHGIHTTRKWFSDYMESLGFVWTPCMGIGTGCKVHLADGELPMGRLVVKVSRHMVAVIDGILNDTFDPTRAGTRCVYGFWKKAEPEEAI